MGALNKASAGLNSAETTQVDQGNKSGADLDTPDCAGVTSAGEIN